jgi:hypothetical protein
MITKEYLKSILKYDPLTGIFTWIDGTPNNPENVHNGFVNYKGYLMLVIKGRHYRQHRLAWLYMTGKWPKNQIDHEDTIKHHNVWTNLREADNQLNHYNLNKPKNNTSGAKGVRKLKNGKFSARIKHNQKEIFLGVHNSLEDASLAYFNKAKELAKEFANQG